MAIWYLDNTIADSAETDDFDGDYGIGKRRNSFSDVTQAVGDTIAIKAGTRWTTPLDVTVASPANESQRFTVRSYGCGERPIIDVQGASAYCVRIQNKNYITVRDLDLYNASNTCLQALGNSTRACNYLNLINIRATGAAFDGISYIQAVNPSGLVPSAALGIVIEGCEAYDCGQHGVAVVAAADGAIIRHCKAARCSFASSGWGVYHGGFASTFFNGWSVVGGSTYSRTLTANLTVAAVWSGQSESAFKLVNGTFGSLNDGEWAQSETTLQINIGNNPNIGTAVAVVYQENINSLMEYCTAYAMSDAHDGVGLGLDRGALNGTIRYCRAYDNPYAGIQINQVDGAVINSCIFHKNPVGISLSTHAGSVVIEQNTVWRCATGVEMYRSNAGATESVRNNIFTIGSVGILKDSSVGGTVTEDYNCVSGYTTSHSGLSAGANDFNTPPVLDAGFRPTNRLSQSGALDLGYTDIYGVAFPSSPSFGAVQYRTSVLKATEAQGNAEDFHGRR